MYFKKTRVLNYFTPGLRLWSNQIPLRFDPYSGCSNRCIYCHLKGTEISTPNDNVEIQDINKGDNILSMDINKFVTEISKVTNTMSRKDSNIFTVETETRKLKGITGEHPLFTKRGWIQVKDLKEDDEVWIE